MCPKTCLEYFELILKILALSGGVLYFIFKFTNGFYIYNLSISLVCERQPDASGSGDYLSLTAELKKGDISSVDLHDVQARVTFELDGQTQQTTEVFRGLRGLELASNKSILSLLWRDGKVLRLSPGEATQFSAMFRVPSGVPCFVEVAVMGRRSFVGLLGGQWKATANVLPSISK